MKKLIFLLLLIPSLCLAGSIKIEDGGGNLAYDYIAPVVPPASLNTTDVTRGFEADSDPAGWTETDTGAILNRFDATQAHSGTHSMSVAGADATVAYYQYATGATRAAMSLCFWVWGPSSSGGDASIIVGSISASIGTHGVRMYWTKKSGVYYANLRGASLPNPVISIQPDTWYRWEVLYAQGATSTLNVYNTVGDLQGTVSLTASDNASQYIYVGSLAAKNVGFSALYIDDIGADWTDSTAPLWEYTVAN